MAKRYNTDAPDVAFEIKRRALTWNCAGCGEDFQSIRKRAYCKPACHGKARKSTEAPGKPGWWICAGCGKEFESDRRRTRCHPKCRPTRSSPPGYAIEPLPTSCQRGRCENVIAMWQTVSGRAHGLWCSPYCAEAAERTVTAKLARKRNPGRFKQPSRRLTDGPCRRCEKVFKFGPKSKGRPRFCPPCREAANREERRREALAARQRRSEQPRPTTFDCKRCKKEWPLPPEGDKRRSVCDECLKAAKRRSSKAGKRRRRAREAGVISEHFTIEDIADRDGSWDCYICGEATEPQSKPWSYNPRGATIDHVIPIARMGPDILSNAKIACHECNNRKSASVTQAVEPLSLF